MPTTRKPRRAPKPKPAPVELLPPGTLIAKVELPARAVPWKAPQIFRNGGKRKDPSLRAWQTEVALRARLAMAGRSAYAGPVRLGIVVELRRKPGSPPDTTNLQKAIEDAGQKIIYVNDTQVISATTERILGERDYTTIEAFSA